MTDNQRAFIRGVGGRGSEVIATLVNLGGKNNLRLDGNDPNRIYFITHNGGIGFVGVGSEYAKTLADFYKEIKLPESWKDGDILIDTICGKNFCVFRGHSEDLPDRFSAYISLELYLRLRDNKPLLVKEHYRLATKDEITHFRNQLHKLGKDWDAEKKRLMDWWWKPNKGGRFYCVNDYGRIESYLWDGKSDFQLDLLAYGNVFQYEYQAEDMLEKFKQLLGSETRKIVYND